MHTPVEIAPYAGPIAVTLIYLGLYYLFQLNLLRVRSRLVREYRARGEKFDRYFGNDREMLAADRIQLNMLEHMPPFLILLWLEAAFVSATWATWGGGLYVLSRAAYPFLMGARLGRGVRARIFVATGLGYVVLTFFFGSLIWGIVS